jgi:hypothetical protein
MILSLSRAFISQEKPHKCSLCAKSFPTPGDLRSHMYVHSGSWPFKCHICSRGFSKQTNLKNHLFLHTGEFIENILKISDHFCAFKFFNYFKKNSHKPPKIFKINHVPRKILIEITPLQ